MRIIGGKYLNWGSEAIRRDTGLEMKDGQGEGWRRDLKMYPGLGDADN